MIRLRSTIGTVTTPSFAHPALGNMDSRTYSITHNMGYVPDDVILYIAGSHRQVVDFYYGRGPRIVEQGGGWRVNSMDKTTASITIWNLGGGNVYAKFLKYASEHVIP